MKKRMAFSIASFPHTRNEAFCFLARRKRNSVSERYYLRCRECQRDFNNRPTSICPECLAPLDVKYDFDIARKTFTPEKIASRPANLWRYSEMLPLPEGYNSDLPVGMTPLVAAKRLGSQIGSRRLYLKNDAVNFPTLSFKDRVVAMALAQARAFGFQTVSCSSTGNLANAVAAQAARGGFDSWIFIPADLEPAKILGTHVFGAKIVRINGNYDQVNRLCSQIGEQYNWGFVNINLRPYYAEGSKTVGFEIAEQLGWRLPDNVVVPMAGGSLITKIHKSFDELIALGLVPPKKVKFFGAQATGCSPISRAVKEGKDEIDPQKPATIARSLAIGNPADGLYASRVIRNSGGWAEDVSDSEIVNGIETLASAEGIFGETAAGVTVSCAKSLIAQGRISPDEETVLCITGNGLKTTDALVDRMTLDPPIEPRVAAFEKFMGTAVAVTAAS
jgi:threonine synthase